MLKIQIIYQKIQKNKTNSIQNSKNTNNISNNIPEAGRQTLVSMERHGLHHGRRYPPPALPSVRATSAARRQRRQQRRRRRQLRRRRLPVQRRRL